MTMFLAPLIAGVTIDLAGHALACLFLVSLSVAVLVLLVAWGDHGHELPRSPMNLLAYRLVERAIASGTVGPYCLQAAIAAVHAQSASPAATDWSQIAALYDVLVRVIPSPVVELNRAVAIAMRDGPAVGLQLIDDIFTRGELANYHLAHSARADLCRRLGHKQQAKAAYQRAMDLSRQEAERRFLARRLAELET